MQVRTASINADKRLEQQEDTFLRYRIRATAPEPETLSHGEQAFSIRDSVLKRFV